MVLAHKFNRQPLPGYLLRAVSVTAVSRALLMGTVGHAWAMPFPISPPMIFPGILQGEPLARGAEIAQWGKKLAV